jgi:hypothetical protein
MIHPALYYWLWTEQEGARIRELELRRATREASKARLEERRTSSRRRQSLTHRSRWAELGARFAQLRNDRRWSG